MAFERNGADIVSRRSELLKAIAEAPPLGVIAIIDDQSREADHIAALLRLLLGGNQVVICFTALATAVHDLRYNRPDLIFLDDHLPPFGRAKTSLDTLHRFALTAPVVIVSGVMTARRKAELEKLGALATLDKDDINGLSLAEVLLRFMNSKTGGAPAL